jgi:hypothetical protein
MHGPQLTGFDNTDKILHWRVLTRRAIEGAMAKPNEFSDKTSAQLAAVVMSASDAQVKEKGIKSQEGRADFLLSTDALNFHRVVWRRREEGGDVNDLLTEKMKIRICKHRNYEDEEFDAALIATRERPRLPYGWTAMDVAIRRLETRPIRFLDDDIERSRYAKGILSLAVHLQEIQGEEPILLPVEQVRNILAAKKVVIAGTITGLVDKGLLEMTKAEYNTGSAREFKFKGVQGIDFEFAVATGSAT